MFRVSDYPINSFLEAYRGEMAAKGIGIDYEPFFFNADYLPLNPLASVPQVNTTGADAAFAVFYTQQITYNVNTFLAFPNVSVRISDDASGQNLEDRPTHLSSIFGRGMRPFVWIRPLLIDPKSSWTTTLNSLDAVNILTIHLCYSGVKIRSKPLR